MVLDRELVAEVFDKCAKSYEEKAWLQYFIYQTIAEWSNLKTLKNQYIIDIGCGPGLLKNFVNIENNLLFKTDISMQMCKQALSRGSELVFNGDMQSIPVKDNMFDITISSLALHWSYNITKSIEEMIRITKETGTICISIPKKNNLWELRQTLEEVSNTRDIMMIFPDINHLSDILKKNLFSKIDIKSNNITKYYNSLKDLIIDLKKTGTNITKIKCNPCILRNVIKKYDEKFFDGSKKQVKASWEIAIIKATR